MDGYDTVILIYPNWWGTLPQAVMTFLDEYDFSERRYCLSALTREVAWEAVNDISKSFAPMQYCLAVLM